MILRYRGCTTQYQRQCEGKLKRSKANAIRQASRRTNETGQKHDAYKCPYCEKWHIGHHREPGDIGYLAQAALA